MKEITRVRCPICGMMPTLDNLGHAEEVPTVRIYIQRMGGKVKAPQGKGYEKKGRGSAPGFIDYEEVTAKVPELVKEMEGFFKKRVGLFLKEG